MEGIPDRIPAVDKGRGMVDHLAGVFAKNVNPQNDPGQLVVDQLEKFVGGPRLDAGLDGFLVAGLGNSNSLLAVCIDGLSLGEALQSV